MNLILELVLIFLVVVGGYLWYIFSNKERTQAKIEADTVKSELDGDIVYLKRSAGVYGFIPRWLKIGEMMKEWHQIYPALNEDGTWNISNVLFGGKRNFVKLITILLIVAMAFYGVYQIFDGLQAQNEILCERYVPVQTQNNTINSICGQPLIEYAADGSITQGLTVPGAGE